MIDGAGGGETLPRHPASKARHLLLGEKAWGAALVERRRNGIAIVRDVRQHGIRRTKLGIFSSGRRLGAGIKSTQRKNVHGRVASMHVSGQMGFPAGRAGAYAAGAGRSRGRTQPGPDTAEAGRSRSWTQPKPHAAGAYAGRGPCAKPGPPAGQLCWPWAG